MGGTKMETIGLIAFIIVFVTSVAAWINTKIIIEDLDRIKNQLGIKEEREFDPIKDFNNSENNINNNDS